MTSSSNSGWSRDRYSVPSHPVHGLITKTITEPKNTRNPPITSAPTRKETALGARVLDRVSTAPEPTVGSLGGGVIRPLFAERIWWRVTASATSCAHNATTMTTSHGTRRPVTTTQIPPLARPSTAAPTTVPTRIGIGIERCVAARSFNRDRKDTPSYRPHVRELESPAFGNHSAIMETTISAPAERSARACARTRSRRHSRSAMATALSKESGRTTR